MNKLEANISLLLITFFAAIQYAFLAGVPDDVSSFSFLCVTNLLGFLIMLIFFYRDLGRLDGLQVGQSLLLSAELVCFNAFLLAGSDDVGAMVSASVLSAYFVFVPILGKLFFNIKPDKRSYPGIVIVLAGLFLMMNADLSGLMRKGVLFLLLADISFSLYILTLGRISSNSNPSVIAMGQMFFSFLFSWGLWSAQVKMTGAPMRLPADPAFWAGVIYISFFIRGLYGIVQIYALRYVSALNTSLIFSSEVAMTMAMSPVMSALFGFPTELITPMRVCGAVLMVLGILAADSSIQDLIRKRRRAYAKV